MTKDEARELLALFRASDANVPKIDRRSFSRRLVKVLERQRRNSADRERGNDAPCAAGAS